MVIDKKVSLDIYVAHLRNKVKLGCYAESPDRFGLVVGIKIWLWFTITIMRNNKYCIFSMERKASFFF
jgi:hypothetical protein